VTTIDPPSQRIPPQTALDELAGLNLADHSMQTVLGLVVDLARRSLVSADGGGPAEASVTLLSGGRPYTAVFSGALAKELDESQYGHGLGPCLHAAVTGEVVDIPDTRDDGRWRDYLDAAVERGCLSSLSLPLPAQEGMVGALNVYSREATGFDAGSREAGSRFASYAAVATGNVLRYQTALDRATNLEAALRSRAVIDQAKGILMERFKVTADQAFEAMAAVSMESNVKLRDVAERFVLTGELDGPMRR
jgi:GAF domain-containing protein